MMKVLIIGGVAAGPKAAAKIMRLRPDAEVTIVEKGSFLSYAGCGLPYYVSGEIAEQKDLMSTPAGAVRDAAFFLNVKNVIVKSGTEAVEVDRQGKRVRVKSLSAGEETWLPYDKLVLATGAAPVVPPISGADKKNVLTLHAVPSAEEMKAMVAGGAKNAVIIGGGLIGVETAEALVAVGCKVTVLEALPQILKMLDWEMAKFVEQHMMAKGVRVLTNTKAIALENVENGEMVAQVKTDKETIAVDLVILAVGVRANVDLARAASLEIGTTGAIKVDDHMCTCDPDIYAAGDCVECVDRLTGRPAFLPLGSTANKQGRVVAVNVCGGNERFPGVLASTVCKAFDFCVARTGLTEKEARELGYDVVTASAPGPDKPHYMPQAKSILMKIVAERKSGRVLGLQSVGPGDGSKRVDVAATAITAGMTLDDLANLDLTYAPPYAPAMDNIITAANVARNKQNGAMDGITAEEVHDKLKAGADFVFLDVRSPQEHDKVRLAKTTLIPLGALRKRANELPHDKEIVTFCQASLRGYEAALILKAAGFCNVKVLDGGVAMWPYEKET
jgi:NADPH-dependent 2,4-dienoyl-CoA reductase/sulfur reductase-like enzyme/rhodanese-related sulfurtransferase